MSSREAVREADGIRAAVALSYCATADPTRMHVERTPTIGEKGSIFLTDFGNLAFASMPTTMGRRTTCGKGRRRWAKAREAWLRWAKA